MLLVLVAVLVWYRRRITVPDVGRVTLASDYEADKWRRHYERNE